MEFTDTKARTKALISLALYKLILKKVPYEEIKVRDICKTAGISHMSFYRYFNSKDDVLVDYCDERFADFYERFFKKDNQADMNNFLHGVFAYFQKYSRQLLVLKKANKHSIIMDQFCSYAKYLLRNWDKVNLPKYVTNPVVPPFLSGGLFVVLMSWLEGGMKESVDTMIEYIYSIVPQLKD